MTTMTLPFTIRDATPTDFPRLAELLSATWPDAITTAEGLAEEDRERDPTCHIERFVTEQDGVIHGLAVIEQAPGMYHPRKFIAWLRVHPDFEGRGVGSALYAELERRLGALNALSYISFTREDHVGGMRFLARRGFTEKMRYFESRLDVAAFDFTAWHDVVPNVEANGFEIKAWADFPDDAAHRRKFYELFAELREDVPRPEPATPVSYEQWTKWVFESPYFIPEANFIAVDTRTDTWAGYSALWRPDAGEYLSTGLTGVHRAYRRNKLALAMKLRAIRHAKDRGVPEIRTNNETNNRPMLSINEALGYVKQPAWVDFVKVLREE
ncbi:GNAT family N-acetyltransferase [Deinococcus yavapaiensis]|nr:GNAT family N-acetyltransferase [Deinococcus yavapaiensis]